MQKLDIYQTKSFDNILVSFDRLQSVFRSFVRSAVPWILDNSIVQTWRAFSQCSVYLFVPPFRGYYIFPMSKLSTLQSVFRILVCFDRLQSVFCTFVRSAVPWILDISSFQTWLAFSPSSILLFVPLFRGY